MGKTALQDAIDQAYKVAKLEVEQRRLKETLPWPPARCSECGRRGVAEKPKKLRDVEAKLKAEREVWRTQHRTPKNDTFVKDAVRDLESGD